MSNAATQHQIKIFNASASALILNPPIASLLFWIMKRSGAKKLHDMELAEWITPNDGKFSRVRPISF